MNNKTIRTDLIKFSISIAVVVTVAVFAIGSIVSSLNAQPSNFTITPGNLTGPVLNCANGKSLTLAYINKGQTCPSTPSPPPTPVVNSTPETISCNGNIIYKYQGPCPDSQGSSNNSSSSTATTANCDDGVIIGPTETTVYDGATNGTHKCGGGAIGQPNNADSPPNTHQPVYGCLEGLISMTITNDSSTCVTDTSGYYPFICLANCPDNMTGIQRAHPK